ncbi:hypothetical protein G7074_02190 [Pedobacter sp. HDW13]|uniref:DUF6428 family protein n=1 Tax=unclassified Pedobacter TaxID=2628915 RepID=UPI000F5A7B5A|nr:MULTISPECIES: DUF6428 family protein [unclassified Pedobacter]QIL38188.1 hypothetical protein G7074_02190 [Pedobacter sp. HDW13]RQO64405.1 hypothetical protein DBR40_25615 [Pedobacter sp. KBW01]
MKLSEIKTILATAEAVNFQVENGETVPEHFHVTEVGIITKDFIDCGGKVRHEKVANFQLWDADDYEHRLKAGKLLNIISLSEKILGMEDLEIEVEYQSGTIGKYDLGFDGTNFLLLAKQTACLAREACGVEETQKKGMVNLAGAVNSCTPGGGCC